MDNRSVTGRIFDIQRFSIHDGPGIRTIVFLKGCVLRCRWCCNPESQSYEIQHMRMGGKDKIVGRDVTVGEVIDEVVKDRPYYQRSGGGMTLSGGESFCQPTFASALFQQAKSVGINTAIETTSCAAFETIEPILPYIDNYLMDIKHMDSAKHKAFTTQPNELMLENAVKIAKQAKRMVVRVPVIPTFNDTVEEIGEIAKFTATLQGVEEIHLLPYHSFGRDKYDGLGRNYPMGDLRSPDQEKMELLLDTAKRYGLKAQIGG
ncbi:MAG: glycyl-radical enzyme activating protein [Clostridia bacterium]|nr:glycyl-radical enzyme activating protein [Clostridia bacterium]